MGWSTRERLEKSEFCQLAKVLKIIQIKMIIVCVGGEGGERRSAPPFVLLSLSIKFLTARMCNEKVL